MISLCWCRDASVPICVLRNKSSQLPFPVHVPHCAQHNAEQFGRRWNICRVYQQQPTYKQFNVLFHRRIQRWKVLLIHTQITFSFSYPFCSTCFSSAVHSEVRAEIFWLSHCPVKEDKAEQVSRLTVTTTNTWAAACSALLPLTNQERLQLRQCWCRTELRSCDLCSRWAALSAVLKAVRSSSPLKIQKQRSGLMTLNKSRLSLKQEN